MPKSGNFLKNIDQTNHQQQSLLQQRGNLSYENLSSSVPSGGTNSATNNVMHMHSHNAGLENSYASNNALIQQHATNSFQPHNPQHLAYLIQQKSNQALNQIQSEPNYHGSFGNVNAPLISRVGGVISSGVSSSSTTSLDDLHNAVISSNPSTERGSKININLSNNLINSNEQQCQMQSSATPLNDPNQAALPEGWDMGKDYDGKIYFIDHRSQTTTWADPRESVGKISGDTKNQAQESAAATGNWDQVCEYPGGLYYVDNASSNKASQELDPRVEWKTLQEEMLRSYLATAESDLKAKQELVDIKQQRLHLAQHDLNHLNTTLSTLSTSTTSLNSTSSNTSASTTTNNKYDPDLLKADVIHAKSRVQRLRRELASIDAEVSYKQRGVETLAQVNARFGMGEDGNLSGQPNLAQGCGVFNQYNNMSVEEANAIRCELQSIQQSLAVGEQEKTELMKNLACLKDDLTRLQHSDSSLDVSSASAAAYAAGNNGDGQGENSSVPIDRFSTASQTDLSGELIPIGARLAEMARIRLRYDEARRHVQTIQQGLAALEDRILPGTLESDKDRLLLIQEKEQLLRELRSITPKSRSDLEMASIRSEINKLERDLSNAMEDSNRCIADRLRLHEEKQLLLQQLRDWLRTMSQLESQLRLLSAPNSSSTPTQPGGMMSTAMSSSASSLGSLSSSHASSKGSLSSLSFTDIYGLSTTTPADPSMLDLHRRVEKILNQGGGMSPARHSQQQLSSSTPQIQTPHRQSITELTSIEEVASPTPSIVEQLQSSLINTETTNHCDISSTDEHFLQSTSGELQSSGGKHGNQQQPQQQQAHHRHQQLQMPTSQLSLSPRSSLSSVSPPVSPHVDYLLQCVNNGAYSKNSVSQSSSAAILLQRQSYSHQRISSQSEKASHLSSVKPGGLVLECANNNNCNNNQSTSSSSSLPSPSVPCPSNSVCEGLSPICERRILESSSSAMSSNTLPSSSNASNVRSSVVSVAASDESVAGDSGVFEAASPAKQPNSQKLHHRLASASIAHPTTTELESNNLSNSQIVGNDDLTTAIGIRETAQVLIRLKYSVSDSLLYVGVEKARNLQALLVNAYPASESSRKICIKGSLLPPVATTGWIFQTSAIGNEDQRRDEGSGSNTILNKVSFGQSFALAVPKSCVDSKTLLLTIWSVLSRKDREDDEECLGSTQLSLADKDLFGTSGAPITPCWYNVLNFHFVMGGVNSKTNASSNLNSQSSAKPSIVPSSSLVSSNTNTLTEKSAQPGNYAHHQSKTDSQLSSRQGTLKEGEQSSDESTIISSQTSTLTRTIDPELLLSTTNSISSMNLNPSSHLSMISQLSKGELSAGSYPYNPFFPNSTQQNSSIQNENSVSVATSITRPSVSQPSSIAKSRSEFLSSQTASSSSISSGPQQGSRQSTPFTTDNQPQDNQSYSVLQQSSMIPIKEAHGVIQSVNSNAKREKAAMKPQITNQHQNQPEDFSSSSLLQHLVDKETNTECVFLSPSAATSSSNPHRGDVRKSLRPSAAATNTGSSSMVPPITDASSSVSSLVRRSQTFSPSAPINKNDYVCKLNRSDSDGSMPLYKRLPLQRRMTDQRRSLRLPSHQMKSMLLPNHLQTNKLSIAEGHELRLHDSSASKSNTKKSSRLSSSKLSSSMNVSSKLQTPLDLELDLAAQQSKLKILQDEIDRLKTIKSTMEEAKQKGNKEIPEWLQENEPFQELLNKFQSDSAFGTVGKSHEERRVEKMIRKTGRDIYKLRKTRVARGEMDVHSFKEKMAFFTTMRAKIPLIPPEMDAQDSQFGHTLDEIIDDEDDDDDNDSGSDCEITDDVIRRRLQMLENFIEKDENRETYDGLMGGDGSGNLPGDISKNSTLKHSDFVELPLSSPPAAMTSNQMMTSLPPLPTQLTSDASTNSSSSRSSTTPTKGVTPPVTVTVNGQVQDFSMSPPDFPPPPPPPDYSDDIDLDTTIVGGSADYQSMVPMSSKQNKYVRKCDLYSAEDNEYGVRVKAANDDSVHSSACSTPTPTSLSGIDNSVDGTITTSTSKDSGNFTNLKSSSTTTAQKPKERYDYEIDPEIGVIV